MLTGRLKDIVNRVDHVGSVSVHTLAEQFGVAVETIRRDLRSLEDAGYLRRVHGGAESLQDNASVSSFGHRQTENSLAKNAMVARAVELIRPGDVVMIDPSSSSWFLAQALPNMDITVITNSIRIVFDLVAKPAINTICVGGRYVEKYSAFLGATTVGNILDFQADICFFSCVGFQQDKGAWDSNALNAGVKKAMLRCSSSNVLLCDSSKFERGGFTLISPIDHIHCVVSEEAVVGSVRRNLGPSGE